MGAEHARAAVEALMNAYYNARDVEATLACVTDTIRWIGTEANDSASGREALRILLEANAAAYPDTLLIELEEPILDILSDTVVLVFVTGHQTEAPDTACGISLRGSATCVKTEQGWLVSSMHVSVPNTEPENYRLAKELDENRKKEQTLMAGIPGGVAIYRMKKDGCVAADFVSDGLARMCGYDNTEEFRRYLCTNAMVNVVSEDIGTVLCAAQRSMETRQPISVMYRIHTKNGQDILQRLDANIMDSALSEDDLAMWYAVHTIVSDESKAILQEQKDLRDLIDAVPAGIGIYEVIEGQLSQNYMNNAFYDMLGTTREQRSHYFGADTLQAVHPEDIKAVQTAIAKLLRGETTANVTYRLCKENGEWFWVHLTGTVVERREGYIKIYAAFSNYDEIVRAQQELEQNRNTLRLALQAAKVFSWRYDYRHARITDSGTLGEAFSLPRVMENLPQSILDMGFVSAESEPDFRKLYEDTATEQIASADIKSTVEGEHGTAWFRQIFTPVFDACGKYVDSIGIAIDITEQKNREQQYEEQLQLNRVATQDALSRVSLNLSKNEITGFESADPDFAGHAKYTTAEELLQSVTESVQEEERKKFDAVLSTRRMIQSFKAGMTHIEIVYHGTEHVKWLRVTYDMIENPYTGDIEAISAIHDATDAVRAELVMNRLMAIDYQSILLIDLHTLNAVPFKRNHTDKNIDELMELQEQNGSGPRGLAAFLKQYAVPGTADAAIRDNSIAVIVQQLEHVPVYECTYSLLLGDEKSHYRVIYSYLENDRTILLCAVQDITDIYEKEEQQKSALALALNEAQAANEAKTAFLSRVSHDMRTPLNGILGLTTLMKDISADPRITHDLTQLELSGQYLLNLINDTLDVSRIESGKLELHPTVCDSRVVFNNIQRLTRPSMEAKNIRLELRAEKLPFTLLYVDEGRLQQIAINILGNAVKFTPEGGVIRCLAETLSIQDGIVTDHFVIEDSGCGMSGAFLPHLFEAFSQENSARTNSNQGTGLGMSITKRLVELMDGEISVQSEQGKGTIFDIILRLPIATTEQVEAWNHAMHAHAINYNLQDKRILLCEDHPLNTVISTRLLHKKGLRVEHAENGARGVKMFAASPENYYDAILMDIRMPVMDGLDATRAIRAMTRSDAKTVPIIAMTANALDDDVRRTREAGMDAHLSKPIEPERLYSALEQFINPNQQYILPRILLVDDIAVNRAVIRAALEPSYEVFEAESGEAALDVLRERHGMDAVVTDIQMPGMNGIELIRRIRANEDYRHMVVIANTQYEMPGQEELLLALGANDFIYKPANPDIVRIRVRNALHKA